MSFLTASFFTAQFLVHLRAQHLDQIDVGPFIKPTNVVGLAVFTFVVHEINGTGMIHDVQPVSGVLTVAVYRQWLFFHDIIDEERDEFLWELVLAVVVRTIGHHIRNAVGLAIGTHKVV